MLTLEGVLKNRYKFATRIVLLLLGAWLTLLAFNSTMVLLPISIGRAIFSSFSRLPITRGAKCNGEFYSLVVHLSVWFLNNTRVDDLFILLGSFLVLAKISTWS